MHISPIDVPDNDSKELEFLCETDKSLMVSLRYNLTCCISEKSIGKLKYYVFDKSISSKRKTISLFDFDEEKKEITTHNYVGFIGLKNDEHHITINIHSRFDNAELLNDTHNNTKDYFLYYMLLKTLGVSLSNLPPECDITTDSHLHLLMVLFPELLINAFSKGLFRKYVTRYTNDSIIRGRINIKRHIRLNMCPPQAQIACDSRQLSSDNNVLQLIRHALEKIDRDVLGHYLLTSNAQIRNIVEELKACTSSYNQNDRRRVIVSNIKTVIHPLYHEYSELQRLSMAILHDEDLSYSEHSNSSPYGIFFDLSEIWENYLAILLKPLGYSHHIYKGNNKYLLSSMSSTKEKYFKIIPDFVKEGDNNYIADAKYIRLNEYFSKKKKDHGEDDQNDRDVGIIYKTITYMHSYSCHDGFLFYPVNVDKEVYPHFEFIINDTDDKIHVIGLNIPLSTSTNSFSDYIKTILTSENEFIDMVRKLSR